MTYLVRVFVFNVFALWFTSQILPTLVVAPGWQPVMLAGFVLSLLMLLVAPILRILFIPINILTFGLLSWMIYVAVILLLTVFVPEVSVREWTLPGGTWFGFVVPSVHLTYWPALVVSSVSVTFFANVLHKISER